MPGIYLNDVEAFAALLLAYAVDQAGLGPENAQSGDTAEPGSVGAGDRTADLQDTGRHWRRAFHLTMAIYLGVVRKEPHTDYWVDFPDIPGCIVGAGSVDELAAKAPAVLQIHIRAVVEAGGLLRTPRAEQDIVASETEEFVSIIPIEVDVP